MLEKIKKGSKIFKKGLTLSIWIWVIAGVSVASIIFLAFYQHTVGIFDLVGRQKSINQYNNIKEKINLLCSRKKGNKEEFTGENTIKLSKDVQAIYAEEKKTDPPDKVAKMISEARTSYGEYICIKFMRDEVPICKKIDCPANITYIGRPNKGSSMWRLSRAKNFFEFNLVLESQLIKKPGQRCTPAFPCDVKVRGRAKPVY